MPVKAKARLVIQGWHCPDNAQGLVRPDAPTVHRTAVSVFVQIVTSTGWCRSLRGVDVSCAFLRKPREIQDPLFFEPLARGVLGVEKASLIEIVKGVSFGLPDSPRRWWKELRDTLQGDSWTPLKLDPACFCLRDFSGHLIGMIIVQVDDMLLATNDSHQAESHISRFLRIYDIIDCKRTDSNEGVLYCEKRIRTVPGDITRGRDWLCDKTRRSLWRLVVNLQVCIWLEPSKRGLSVQQEMRSVTGNLHWATEGHDPTSHLQPFSCRGNIQHPWHPRLRSQPEIGSMFRPLPTKM